MKLALVTIVTANLEPMRTFYQQVLQIEPQISYGQKNPNALLSQQLYLQRPQFELLNKPVRHLCWGSTIRRRTKRMAPGCSSLHAVRQTNKRCTTNATIIRIRACSSGWKPCGSRAKVCHTPRAPNCVLFPPIPCDRICSCIKQAVWKP